jgi:hypothetical protein
MGQACCISTDKASYIAPHIRDEVLDSWKSSIKSVLSFQDPDTIVKIWKEFEIYQLKVINNLYFTILMILLMVAGIILEWRIK